MLIVPPSEICGYSVNGWGIEFSDWHGFFSSDKSGGTEVDYSIISQEEGASSLILNLEVNLPKLSCRIKYWEKRSQKTIYRGVFMRVLEPGLLGDLVLRCRLLGAENSIISQNGSDIGSGVALDRNHFMQVDAKTEFRFMNGNVLEVFDKTRANEQIKLHRYFRKEELGLRFHSRLLGIERYRHSFAPYFVLPYNFKLKYPKLLDDKFMLCRERFRKNLIQKYWQKVPFSRVNPGDIFAVTQTIKGDYV